MKQIALLFAGVIVFIIAVGIFTKDLTKPSSTTTQVKKEVSIEDAAVLAEIADDEAERKIGLSEKAYLGEDEGMLFVFPEKTSSAGFWMKDMKFPIDIVWINDDKVVKIDKNVKPEPGVGDEQLKLYYPETPINYVLEVKAGFAEENSVKPGDKVVISD